MIEVRGWRAQIALDSKRWIFILIFAGFHLALFGGAGQAKAQTAETQTLGQFLYFDRNLSEPAGQACADCHLPEAGFADPDSLLPVSEGVVPGMFGERNTPTAAYAMYSPALSFDPGLGSWIGGQFWDGRATGALLGDPLADQAVVPFLNPEEMANVDMASVVRDAQDSLEYGAFFKAVCNGGAQVDLTDPVAVQDAYNCVGHSIAAFERTAIFAPFDSKYDYYLQTCLDLNGLPDECAKGIGAVAKQAGDAVFTPMEWQGLQLFMNNVNNNDGIKDLGEGTRCEFCHVANWTLETDYAQPVVVPAWAPEGMVPPLFTDFSYHNLGMPVNMQIAALIGAPRPVDLGLGPVVSDANEDGKFKVMTVRNNTATAPYGHNGMFATLQAIVHFYNMRDIPGSAPGGVDFPPPEVPATVNTTDMGMLALTPAEGGALMAFLFTLSDGFVPPATQAADDTAGDSSSGGSGGCFIMSLDQ